MRYLYPGARVGLIAPSSPVYEKENQQAAIELLESMGYEVKAYESISAQRGYLSGSDQVRARDIMSAFRDPAIDAVVCLRGGYGAGRVLPLLDYDVMRRNPKPFVGYSDITALHLALYEKARLVTYHGPMPGSLSPWGLREEKSRNMWIQALSGRPARRPRNPNGDDFIPLRPGRVGGVLLGGNLTVLTSLVGSPYLPDFTGKLLLLEDVGERPYRIDRMLNQLRVSGILDRVAGILLGDFTECEEDPNRPSLDLEEIFRDHLPPVPILWNVHAGHGQDKITLPLGVPYLLDADQGQLTLMV